MGDLRNRYIVSVDDDEYDIELTRQADGYLVEYGESRYLVKVDQLSDKKFLFKINERASEVDIIRNGNGLEIFLEGKEVIVRAEPYDLAELRKRAGAAVDGPEDKIIKAPMPGLVLSTAIAPGDTVAKGQTLVIIEAMKMENMIKAPYDATIKEIFADPGSAVDKNEKLVEFE